MSSKKQYSTIQASQGDNEIELNVKDDDVAEREEAENEALRDKRVALQAVDVEDEENRGLRQALGTEKTIVAPIQARNSLDTMKIKVSSTRSPEQVRWRRILALVSLGLLLVVLAGILIVESLAKNVNAGLALYKAIAPETRQVYVLSLYNDGAPLSWGSLEESDIDLKMVSFKVVDALKGIPFRDFSFEMLKPADLSEPIIIACVKEKSKKVLGRAPCPAGNAEGANAISNFSSSSIGRCFDDTSSALKNAVKCPANQRASEEIFHRVFSQLSSDTAVSNRCCDYNQEYFDAESSHQLRICSSTSQSSKTFLKYLY